MLHVQTQINLFMDVNVLIYVQKDYLGILLLKCVFRNVHHHISQGIFWLDLVLLLVLLIYFLLIRVHTLNAIKIAPKVITMILVIYKEVFVFVINATLHVKHVQDLNNLNVLLVPQIIWFIISTNINIYAKKLVLKVKICFTHKL